MAKKVNQIQFSTRDRVGVLAVITAAMRVSKINILHLAAWSDSGKGFFNMVTNNNSKAKQILRKLGISSKEGEGILINLQNKVGTLEKVTRKLAKANISITCLSATSGGSRTSVLLHTKNNAKALRII